MAGIKPNLSPFHDAALQMLNGKKPEEQDAMETALAAKLAQVEGGLMAGNQRMEALEREAQQVQAATQRAAGAYEGIIDLLWDHYQEITARNKKAKEIVGEELKEEVGKPLTEILGSEEKDPLF